MSFAFTWVALAVATASAYQKPETASPVRIADAACANCHREIFEKYLTTPMANASGPAVEKFKTGTLNHKTSGAYL